MSRLRCIFVEGRVDILHAALEDVLFLSKCSNSKRSALLQHVLVEGRTTPLRPSARRDDTTSEVPDLFMAVAKKAQASKNAHYKQAVVVWYMLHDSELFGRFMLQHETPALQDLFMKALKEMTAFFIAGHQMDGSLFKPGDDLNQRRTGNFITRLRELFIML